MIVESDMNTAPIAGECDYVVPGRPDKILLHLPVACLRERDESDDVEWVVLDQNDVSRLDGDVRPGANGNADVGPRERRRVVDAIADHLNSSRESQPSGRE